MRVEDVRDLMRARKLPEDYAAKFIAAARGNRWWSNSIGCAGPRFAPSTRPLFCACKQHSAYKQQCAMRAGAKCC